MTRSAFFHHMQTANIQLVVISSRRTFLQRHDSQPTQVPAKVGVRVAERLPWRHIVHGEQPDVSTAAADTSVGGRARMCTLAVHRTHTLAE